MFATIEKTVQKLFFTRNEQQAFLEDITSLIKDGVPAPQAIMTVQEISTGISKDVAANILQSIAEGQRIADGMSNWFPPTIVEIIRAGEEGGTLVKSLETAAKSLEKQHGAIVGLLTSTVYPVTVFFMALIVAIFLKHSIFENFAEIRPISTWPFEGQMVVGFAGFLENWWWLVVIFLIIAGYGIKKILTDSTGEMRKIVDNLPLLSLYRKYAAASFMQTLGLLLTNGIGLKHALNIMQRSATKYQAWHIYRMQFRLSGGRENVADVLDTGLIEPANLLRLKVMAKGKGFDEALVSLGVLSLERTTKAIQQASRISGGIILFLDAAIAIFMILAIYNVGAFVGAG